MLLLSTRLSPLLSPQYRSNTILTTINYRSSQSMYHANNLLSTVLFSSSILPLCTHYSHSLPPTMYLTPCLISILASINFFVFAPHSIFDLPSPPLNLIVWRSYYFYNTLLVIRVPATNHWVKIHTPPILLAWISIEYNTK